MVVGGPKGQCHMLTVQEEVQPIGPLIPGGLQCSERIDSVVRNRGFVTSLMHAPSQRFVSDAVVVMRAVNGQMWACDVAQQTVLASWKVPGCTGLGAHRCRFGATADGAYVVTVRVTV